jgi:hypothetical protein
LLICVALSSSARAFVVTPAAMAEAQAFQRWPLQRAAGIPTV